MICDECINCEYYNPRECDFDSYCTVYEKKVDGLDIKKCEFFEKDEWK